MKRSQKNIISEELRSVLKKNNKLINGEYVNKIVGVAGTGHGVGATHFCLMLSTFMATVAGKKVALVELNQNDCLRQAEIVLKNFAKERKVSKRVIVYKQALVEQLPDIISAGYDVVVIDFGYDLNQNISQFLMCSTRIVVGNMSWWRLHEMVGFIAKNGGDKGRAKWLYFAAFWTKSGMKYLKHNFKINVQVIPFVPNPFCFSEEVVNSLWDIMEML